MRPLEYVRAGRTKKEKAFGFPKAFSFPIHRDLTQDKADSSMVLSRKDVYRDKAQFIYEVADLSGFSSDKSFYRNFKNITDKSPKEIR